MQARMLKRQKPERQSRRLPRVVRARPGVAFSRHQLGGNMRLTMFAAAAAFAMSTAHAATTYEGNGQVPEQFVVSGAAAERLHDHNSINLATAEKLVAACQAMARKINSPVVVVILDPQGL